jgi:transcriptional regulator with XRE-family HTH domain
MRARKPKEPPPPESLVLSTLRKARGWTGQELAAASGTSDKMISRYESGQRPPSRERLEALAAAMGYGPAAIDLVLLALKGAAGGAERPRSPVDPAPGELRGIRTVAARVGLADVDLTEKSLVRLLRTRRARKARRQAARLWAQLRNETAAKRRLLVERAREYQTWALSERLCHASEDAASDRADLALELAGLACRVAELAPGEKAWRSRLQGYALAYLANARRVAGDLPGAEETFARAWKLWEAGAEADSGLLAEWRLLDLEASLHRDRRRFREALDRLDQVRAAAPPTAVGRILVKKAATLDQLGEAEQSIETLREAAPLVDGKREPRLLFGLRFILAVNLCHLGRYAEAETLLPEVRALAMALRKELDLVRVLWLDGKIAAGLDRHAEAASSFEQVRREFTAREIAWDSALVTLELAELYLREGRTWEVRALVEEMVWVFRSQGIHREALAALHLFFEAARKDAATVELARKVGRYLHRAQNDPELRFEI